MIPVFQLRDYCGITNSDAKDDTVLAGLEARAVELISQETGCYWGAEEASHTYYLDGSGGVLVWLPDHNATIASVEVRWSVDSEFSALDATDYEQDGRQLRRVDGDIFPLGAALVRVIASRGYADGAAPAVIRQAVMDYVNFMFRPGRTSVLSGDFIRDLSVIPNWKRAIELYRTPLYA